MQKLELSDVKNLQEYELIRDDFRRHVIEEKAKRRVLLGPKISLVFENRLTVLAQVQEMCRIERIARPEKVQEELDVYNTLLPGAGELAATLFIEIADPAAIQRELDALIGLADGRALFLELNGRRVAARFSEGESRPDRIAAVQYVKFPVGEAPTDREALAAGEAPVLLRAEHPRYRAVAELSEETRRELARDLA
ncbi:MAG TPA: DUF3501 family protein [Thermoanaerobaculia bacterium]|nr:DUF3501 family protein [Thermoanaerobaculia bacterium]